MPRVQIQSKTHQSTPFINLKPRGREKLFDQQSKKMCDERQQLDLTTAEWINVCQLAKPPLNAVTSSCASEEYICLTAGNVDLSGYDTRGNSQNEVATACHAIGQHKKMMVDSTHLKATWTNLQKGTYLQDLAVNQKGLKEIDDENLAELKKAKAHRIFQILRRADAIKFHGRDEIKTLNRCLMEVEAMKDQAEQANLTRSINKKCAERDEKLFQTMVDHDQFLLEQDQKREARRRRILYEAGEELKRDVLNNKKRHKPPLFHDFNFIHQQANRIREHNKQLAEKESREEKERAVTKGNFRAELGEQLQQIADIRKQEAAKNHHATMRQREFMRDLIDRIQNVNAHQKKLQKDKIDSLHSIQKSAVKRADEERARQREWEDPSGQQFFDNLAEYDRIAEQKRLKREKASQELLDQLHDQREYNKIAEKARKKESVRQGERITADVIAFHKEEEAKEEKRRKLQKELGKALKIQKIEKEERDGQHKEELAIYRKELQQKMCTDQKDLMIYGQYLADQRQGKGDGGSSYNLHPLYQALNQINHTHFVSLKTLPVCPKTGLV